MDGGDGGAFPTQRAVISSQFYDWQLVLCRNGFVRRSSLWTELNSFFFFLGVRGGLLQCTVHINVIQVEL